MRAKLCFGVTLAVAVGMLGVILSASATAAEQIQVATFGSPGAGAGQLSQPGGVAVEQSTGDFYVADTENQRVDKFGPDGEFLLAWGWGVEDGTAAAQTCTTTCQAGLGGSEPGQLDSPRGIAVAPNGDVYVLNSADGRVIEFSPTGTFEGEFGGFGPGEEQFSFGMSEANNIAVDPAGRVLVSDPQHRPNGRVAIFSAAGTLVGAVETQPGRRLENFGAVASGPNGEILVGSLVEGGVAVYSQAGVFERAIGRGLTVSALAVDPQNGNVLVQSAKGFSKVAYTLGEYTPSGELVGAAPVSFTQEEFPIHQPIGLAYDGNPAADVPGSAPGLVLAVDTIGGRVLGLAEPAPAAPGVFAVGVSANNGDGANVTGTVEPHGLATTYFVRYGTTSAYGLTTPPTSLPASHKDEHATVHLVGLAPGTTYHYSLVATNALGEASSPDRTFTTMATGSPFTLPDGRAYELVSPAAKGNNDIEAHGVSSLDGEAVNFYSFNGLPGAESGALLGASVASRGGSGWATVPASPATENEATLLASTPLAVSGDLRQEVVQSTLDLTGNAPRANNLYLRTNASAPGQPAGEQLITPEAGRYSCPNEPLPTFVGASADFRHLVFSDAQALTPDSTPIAEGFECALPQLYEWSNGILRNIGILPGETTPSPTGATAVGGAGMVSEDGATVFFTAKPEAGFSAQPQLYVRTAGTTVRVSEPRIPTAEPNAFPAKFQAASSNGSVVYFTTQTRLTADASPTGADLYRYVVATGALTDLTPDPQGAEARQAVTSADGDIVYFGATGALAPGATEGEPNLYRLRIGGSPEFLAKLAVGDPLVSSFTFQPTQLSTRMTTDGGVLLLGSEAALDPNVKVEGSFGQPVNEIYRHVAGAGFTCVSCANRGEAVAGAQVKAPTYPGSPGGNVLSADGSRVFFETADALVPQDNNGKVDVYEWEGGQDHLISTGSSSSDSALLDADPSGTNVFFTTRQQLVRNDQDEKSDVYDARVGGGFAEAPATGPPCEAEACRPPTEAAPTTPQIGSRSFVGPANKKHKPKKKHKHKHAKKHGKHGKKKHRGKHGKHQTGKRG